MRLLVVLSSIAAVWAGAAAAESWKEYDYSDLGFAVSFPADPTMENLSYKAADGTIANEILYSVRQGADIFSVAVVDLSHASVDETAALNSAIDLLREKGEIRLDIPARVSRHFGRQLSIAGNDGSHSAVAIFFADHRLYQIQGTVLAESDDPGSGDAIRFQQSLRFTGDNRGPGFGPRFGGRQFRGGQRFRQNQAPADQTPPVSGPEGNR